MFARCISNRYMSRKSRTEFAILGMLTHGPSSGYDLKRLFEERIAHFWSESVGQIYPTLKKLASNGMVTAKETTGESGPRRIEYRITAKGKKHLQGWLHEPVGKEHVRNELTLKLFFGPHSSTETMLTHIDTFEALQKSIQNQFAHYSDQIEVEPGSELQKVYWRMALRSGQLVNEARLKWCREARKLLEDHVEKKPKP